MKPSRKDWSSQLDNALWALNTAWKTPIGTTPYRMLYGKACHLPVEMEKKSLWALRKCNVDTDAAGAERMLQLNEVEELRFHAYESARIYKDKTKKFHDSNILSRVFTVGMLVLLFNSRYKLFPGKLKCKWTGPYEVLQVFPYGTLELKNLKDGSVFKANGHRCKEYHCDDQRKHYKETVLLVEHDDE